MSMKKKKNCVTYEKTGKNMTHPQEQKIQSTGVKSKKLQLSDKNFITKRKSQQRNIKLRNK